MKIIALLLIGTLLGIGIFALIPQADAATGSGIKVWFCMNKPWSLFNAEEKHYHAADQKALKSEVLRNCDKAPNNIVWSPHGNVYVLVFAPAFNDDPYVPDIIGKEEGNEIWCTGEDGTVSLRDGSSVGMMEIGTDTGIFGGRVKLAGDFMRTVDGELTTFGRNSVDPRTASPLDRGSMCNLKTTASGGFSWTWEYSEDKFISKSGEYSFREGQVRFDKDIYNMADPVKIILDDVDLLRWTFDSKVNYIDVWSDSDPAGITAKVKFQRDWWKSAPYDGTHYATINLQSDDSSKTHNYLRAGPGDNIYVRYYDYTLPQPYSKQDCTKKFNRGPINNPTHDCEHLAIENYAKISSGNSITVTSNPDTYIPVIGDDILEEQNNDSIIPSKTSLTKYTLDGESKIYLWWEPDGAPLTNIDYDLNLLFHEAQRDVLQSDVSYDLEIKFNDQVIKSAKNTDSIGKISENLRFDEPGMMTVKISNINGEERHQDFTLVVDEKPILYLNPEKTPQEVVGTSQDSEITPTTTDTIPDWIKINAKWWSDAQINDQEFVKGIEYLIQEEVIQVSYSEESINDVNYTSIPTWVRNNAEWWSEGAIGDNEFATGLQYMINNGLIKV